VQALLVKDSTKSAIVGELTPLDIDHKTLATIQLTIKDGPLYYIQHETTAQGAWKVLKMYQPKGFTSEYLVYKEFFENTLAKHDTRRTTLIG
jgi:gag-polypeptide of LTR copia-type